MLSAAGTGVMGGVGVQPQAQTAAAAQAVPAVGAAALVMGGQLRPGMQLFGGS